MALRLNASRNRTQCADLVCRKAVEVVAGVVSCRAPVLTSFAYITNRRYNPMSPPREATLSRQNRPLRERASYTTDRVFISSA